MPNTSSAVSGTFSASAPSCSAITAFGRETAMLKARYAAEQQRGRQRAGEAREVAAHALGDVGRGLRQREERFRDQQQRGTDDRERERQPHRLVQRPPAVVQPAGAVELRGDRAECHHDAHEADEDRDVGGGSRPRARRGRAPSGARPSRVSTVLNASTAIWPTYSGQASVGDAARVLEQRRAGHGCGLG